MQRFRSWLVVAGFTVATLLASASCGSNGPGTEVVQAGTVSVLKETGQFTGSSAGVGVGGRLVLVGGQCVGFIFGTAPTLIHFPNGTSVSGSGQQLVISVEGVSLHIGDRFEAGSREGESRPLSDFGDLDQQAPGPCQKYHALPVSEFVT
jgi:hypothetical protein